MPRVTATKPQMLSEFEERFRRILKRIYRSLQQHEIREEVIIFHNLGQISGDCLDYRRTQAHYVAVASAGDSCGSIPSPSVLTNHLSYGRYLPCVPGHVPRRTCHRSVPLEAFLVGCSLI